VSATDDSHAYPGEFEVLRTKAETGTWDSGTLVVTNYRVSWAPSRFSKAPSFSFRLEDIESVKQVRSIKYLFLGPTLRIRLRDGAVYEVSRTGEDINRVKHVIDDYRGRERYRPGSLFEGGS
jgi:hypothetical protein